MRGRVGELPKALIPVPASRSRTTSFACSRGKECERSSSWSVIRGAQLRAESETEARSVFACRYVDEGDELHGTGGALRFALDAGALPTRSRFCTATRTSRSTSRPSGPRSRRRSAGAHDRAPERGSLGPLERGRRGRRRGSTTSVRSTRRRAWRGSTTGSPCFVGRWSRRSPRSVVDLGEVYRRLSAAR